MHTPTPGPWAGWGWVGGGWGRLGEAGLWEEVGEDGSCFRQTLLICMYVIICVAVYDSLTISGSGSGPWMEDLGTTWPWQQQQQWVGGGVHCLGSDRHFGRQSIIDQEALTTLHTPHPHTYHTLPTPPCAFSPALPCTHTHPLAPYPATTPHAPALPCLALHPLPTPSSPLPSHTCSSHACIYPHHHTPHPTPHLHIPKHSIDIWIDRISAFI